MSNSTSFVSMYTVLMLMSLTQHPYLQYHHNSGPTTDTPAITRRIRYQALISSNHIARFTFVGLNDILCYQLMQFTLRKVEHILLLLSLHEIRFRNRLQATPEEDFAIVLIRLSYSTRYLAMMDQFGYSRTWLSIVFNDTIIPLYRRYRKKLIWDDRRLTFARLSIYS